MNTAWQSESGSIECRWALALESGGAPSWLKERSAKETRRDYVPPLPNFAEHSPFGSGEWIVPWGARWRTLQH